MSVTNNEIQKSLPGLENELGSRGLKRRSDILANKLPKSIWARFTEITLSLATTSGVSGNLFNLWHPMNKQRKKNSGGGYSKYFSVFYVLKVW